jgi:hypothetical protein
MPMIATTIINSISVNPRQRYDMTLILLTVINSAGDHGAAQNKSTGIASDFLGSASAAKV